MTNFLIPRAILLRVFSERSFLRPNMEGQGKVQSIISAAVRHFFNCPFLTASLFGSPWVGYGHTIGNPSQRAIINKRFRMVGAP